jgi:hypothetical protein
LNCGSIRYRPHIGAVNGETEVQTTLNAIREHSPCRCGCGLPAPKYQRNNAAKGHVKGAHAPYISGHNKRGTTKLFRFEIDKSGCWIWTGSKDRKGYGRAQVDGVHTHAHRAIYKQLVGDIPSDMHLDHLCRNVACVNPAHMEPVSPQENVKRQHAARRLCARIDARVPA